MKKKQLFIEMGLCWGTGGWNQEWQSRKALWRPPSANIKERASMHGRARGESRLPQVFPMWKWAIGTYMIPNDLQ